LLGGARVAPIAARPAPIAVLGVHLQLHGPDFILAVLYKYKV